MRAACHNASDVPNAATCRLGAAKKHQPTHVIQTTKFLTAIIGANSIASRLFTLKALELKISSVDSSAKHGVGCYSLAI